MKKLVIVLILVLVLASSSFAQLLIGARSAGMGGAGVAIAKDLTAAYYNPAAFMRASTAGGIISLGASLKNSDKIIGTIASLGDPVKFFADNYSNNLDFTGNASGIFGFQASKVGITAIPLVSAVINKPASSLYGTISGNLQMPVAATLGYSVEIPMLGAIDVGTNLKYIYSATGGIATSGDGQTINQTTTTGGGVGLDLGVLATVSVPLVTEMSLGFAARDLMQNLSYTSISQAYTVSGQTYTKSGPETTTKSSTLDNSTYTIGASAVVPGAGLLVAADIENVAGPGSYSNTHIGLEYPVLPGGLLTLRAGTASGTGTSLTTYGAKIGIPIFTINAAYVTDHNFADNSYFVLDLVGAI